jgi:YHS domain-containing protein
MKTVLSKTLKPTILGIIAAAFLLNWTATGIAFEKVNQTAWGVAIKGYDPVAYHTEGRAVEGQSQYVYAWNDAKWHFASAKNRDLFEADPERYAPQYGGY